MYCNIKIHSVDKLSNYGFVQLSHRLTEEHSKVTVKFSKLTFLRQKSNFSFLFSPLNQLKMTDSSQRPNTAGAQEPAEMLLMYHQQEKNSAISRRTTHHTVTKAGGETASVSCTPISLTHTHREKSTMQLYRWLMFCGCCPRYYVSVKVSWMNQCGTSPMSGTLPPPPAYEAEAQPTRPERNKERRGEEVESSLTEN
ncbi:hypothetical protein F2P81_021577 [Scophthalmus maximus]|uniref:Uncharacterized protein n=1 Tax=Scophthalmus maximus TaxID=52904 RepID=A0A6A4S5N3_SCOMX|nr:hypothetical protein F2P81_021577 [Scophthalmus maximus]